MGIIQIFTAGYVCGIGLSILCYLLAAPLKIFKSLTSMSV